MCVLCRDMWSLNSEFGTAADLHEMIDTMHRLGMWAMLDTGAFPNSVWHIDSYGTCEAAFSYVCHRHGIARWAFWQGSRDTPFCTDAIGVCVRVCVCVCLCVRAVPNHSGYAPSASIAVFNQSAYYHTCDGT